MKTKASDPERLRREAERQAEQLRKQTERALRNAQKKGEQPVGPDCHHDRDHMEIGPKTGPLARLATAPLDLAKAAVRVGSKVADGVRRMADARKEAEDLWFKPVANPDRGFRTIESDARDVNEPFSSKTAPAAAAQVEKNKDLENGCLSTLTADQRAQYERVAAQTKDDPHARLALQLLLLEGKLPGTKPDKEGQNLLGTLDKLSTQPMHADIDRAALVSDLVQEIALPSAINQHDKATCTVTTMQILMAQEHPAEYARIVGGLASPTGKVKLANGDEIARETGTHTDDGTARSISSRLWQPSLMEYGNGSLDYDNANGKHSDGHSGLYRHEVDRVADGLSGRDVNTLYVRESGNLVTDGWHSLFGDDNAIPRAEIVKRIKQSTAAGNPVPVAMAWGDRDENGRTHGGHEILVTRIEGERVYYKNPWGTEESMTLKEFQDRLWHASMMDV